MIERYKDPHFGRTCARATPDYLKALGLSILAGVLAANLIGTMPPNWYCFRDIPEVWEALGSKDEHNVSND